LALLSKNDEAAKQGREKVLVLVKALPHAGRRHGETVCCAGVSATGSWRRQYPIHFRQLQHDFSRWDWIEYDWIRPKGDDQRKESRRVQEHTLKVSGHMRENERAGFLNPLLCASTKHAASQGMSLALIRPKSSRFYWKKRTQIEIDKERKAYRAAAQQLSLLDSELAALNPCPYEFKFDYQCEDGQLHRATCDDWETTAMFNAFQRRYGEQRALTEMDRVFNHNYPAKGMAFAMGTHSRFPDIWLLVGVIRLDEISQLSLAI